MFTALILVVLPTVIIAAMGLRAHGLQVDFRSVWTLHSIVGIALLGMCLFYIAGPQLEDLFNGSFFPSRSYLLFLITGMAFAVLIVPGQTLELLKLNSELEGNLLRWLIVLPAWLWMIILLVIGLQHAN
ncbi:MAG: hypothetical protein F6K31_34395 [Symploca sp. SIO2G7]|nr:hypothetical protein [Symploca sp. SIO2G7]